MKTTYRWKVGRLLIAAGLTALFFASMANGAPTAYKATLVGLLDATVATPVDSDADGFSNGADPDDDNDGLTDVYETSVGLDPFDSSDAAMDSDHDGASNLDEFLASSDPFDFLSCSGATCAFEPAPQRNQISIPPVDTYSDQVGAIAASMGVNAVGNLTYSIPLFSFTGTAGLQPNLTLSYNSGDGNGLVGVGWSISGTSIINRCPRTKAQDGVNSNVTLDQADRFCIDGQRLVLADPSQSYGGNLVEYRTEIDSNRKVVSYGGTLTDGPEFFRVWDEDGSVSVYGNTENSRVYAKSAVSKPIIWARSEKYDAHSFATNSANKIAYQYYNPKYMGDADYGNIRLLAIGYAASEPGSYAKVNFVYDNPGVRPDISKSFSYPGLPTLTDTRLKSISASYVAAGSPGGIIRTFNIAYKDEVSTIGRNNSTKVHSVTECAGAVCLRPTVFTWSDQATDFSFSTTSTNVVGFENYIEPPPSTTRPEVTKSSSITANVDGDSNRDLIWIEGASGDFSFRVAMSTGSTLVTTSYESSSFNEIYGWTVTDYNHDNYADFLVVSAANGTETLNLFLNKDVGGGVRGYETTPVVLIADLGYASTSTKAQFSDFNSDGEIDLLYDFKIRYLEPDPQQLNGPFRFSTESVYITESTINSLISSAYNSAGSLVQSSFQVGQLAAQHIDEVKFGTDFTRDGIPDIHMPVYHRQCNYVTEDPPEYSCQPTPLVAAEFIFKGNPSGGFTFWGLARLNYGGNTRCWPVDLNSDGLPDLVCDGGRIIFNGGANMRDTLIAASIANQLLHSLIDYNQDGYLDFVYKEVNTPRLKVLLWKNGIFEEDPTKAIDIAYTNYYEPFGPAGSFLDINGDGLDDYVNFNTGVFLGRTAATATNSTKAYNLITKIRDGLGNEKHIDYKPMTDASVYVRESDALSKNWGPVVVDYIAPRYVVSQVRNKTPAFDDQTASFNIDATSAMSYSYAGMKVQPAGRGMLGFHKMSVLDEQTGMRTETTYLQQFPFTGLPAESKTYVANNATPLSETSLTYAKLNNLNGPDAAPFRPVVTNSVEINRVAGTVTNSAQVTVLGELSTVTTTFGNYTPYGSAGMATITKVGDGNTYQTVTLNTYNHNTTKWHINQLLTTQTTTTQNGASGVVRQAAFTYDSNTGLLASEVQEPNNSAYTVATTYLRDNFGNRIRATETAGGVSRYTRVVYDASGRYINQIFNSLEQAEMTVISRNAYGAPTVTANMDGVLTYTAYGALGREYFQGNDSGGYSKSEYRFCESGLSCPEGAVYRLRSMAADGSESTTYFDNLSRSIRQQVKGFDGTLVTTDVHYDKSGRVRRASNPYKSSEAVLWSVNDYDVAGRLRKTTDVDNNIATSAYDRYTSGSFVGLRVIATNAEGQTKAAISDARGLAYLVTDDLGGRIAYQYDARGNLTKLISQGSAAQPLNIETVISYDLLGRRVSLNDPDQGTWSYQYSLFNDLTQQEDALGQRTEMTYDALGRMLNRVDKKAGGTVIEGNTSWVYDSASNGLGKVSTVTDSASGYVMAYDYDDLGRIHQTYTSLGTNGSEGNFSQIVTYDQIGRVFQEVDATKHGVQYSYNSHGYMEKIAEATDTTKKYKQIETVNAWGSETQSMLGNGLKVQSTYHATTGLPDRVLVTNPLTQTIQDNTYAYNDIGILTNRSRFVKSNASTLSETFHYDELNRLTQATATGLPTQSFQYDIKGNITSKSDVGTYTYGAGSAGPHAVTTAGSDTFTYDATGNMLTGGGRTVTYNTFRKPLTLSKGTHTSTFTYGPDRSHYKRVDADGTTVKTTLSIGNVEFITHSSGVTETKRYIGDIAVVTETSNGSPSTQYLHKDTLGSTDIITDAVGGVVAEMSFDAFGKRRNVLTLAELAEAQYDVLNAITTQGFTGHEMVDEVGIIHMGGRIYDPELGRFMSADPIVQSISNAQNLNRYSYVLNNPLSLVDPSGFRSKRPSGGKITTIVVTGESTSRNDCQWYEGGCWIGDQIGYEELIFGEGGSGGEDPVNNAEPDFEALRQETKIAISLAMIKATKEIDIVTLDQICGESGVVCGADVIAQFSPGASTGSNNDSGDGEETKSGGGGGVLSGSNNTTGYWENEVSPGKHEYERFSDAICKLETSGCTRDNVLNILNEVGVHPGQEKPFTPGQPYIADADLPFVPFSDHINTIALYDQSEAQIGVRNTTTDDHLLNPGYVERYVVEIGGEIKIRTYGEGEGILGGANVRFVDNTWAPIDSQVSEEFHRRFAP